MSPKEAKVIYREIFAMIVELQGNVEAASFCSSVAENARCIKNNINEWRKVTPRQAEALENMKVGLKKWINGQPGKW
jgi:hypothetical protein